MKKILMSLVFVAAVAAGVFAGGAKDAVSVEGKLVITDSIPTIVSGTKTWILPVGPFYQIAYENNIKAGDTLKVEGFENECPADFAIKDANMLLPTKVTVNGKALDLSTFEGRGMMGGPGPRGDRDGMMDGRGGPGSRGGMMGGRGAPGDNSRNNNR